MRAAIVSGCRSRAPALPASRSIDPVVDVSRAREGPRAAGLAPPRAPPGRPEQPRCVCPKFAATPYILRIAPACPSFQQHNTRTVAAVATAASGSGFQVMCSSTRCRFCGAVALFVHALADEQLSWMSLHPQRTARLNQRCLGIAGNKVLSSPGQTRIYRWPSRTGRVYRIRTRYVTTVVGFL